MNQLPSVAGATEDVARHVFAHLSGGIQNCKHELLDGPDQLRVALPTAGRVGQTRLVAARRRRASPLWTCASAKAWV